MKETVEFLIDEYKKRLPWKNKPEAKVTIPKAFIKENGFAVGQVLDDASNHPDIFEDGIVDKGPLLIIPSINKDNIDQ